MSSFCIILGDQLFNNHPAFDYCDDYVMLESADFNSDFQYHKGRVLHCFVAMREYSDYLVGLNKNVRYYKYDEFKRLEDVFIDYASLGYSSIIMSWVENKELQVIITSLAKHYNMEIKFLQDQKFLTNSSDWKEYRSKYPKRLFMQDFYIFQRKRLKLFLDENNNSSFGSWSLDADNRKKIPKQLIVPSRVRTYNSNHYDEVFKVVNKYFGSNYGALDKIFYPVNRQQALESLDNFITDSFKNFGDYEDALSSKDPYLFHSILSPSLNNGLIVPSELIEKIIQVKNIPDNSKEGLIRQIIGWREWVRLLYWNEYKADLSNYNYWKNSKKLPDYFWDSNKLELIKDNTPLYNTLKNVYQYGYCHHIERLMVLANWMTLNEYHPMDCYKWFMTAFIDSYEWVMVANVFGMGLYADGGIFATKPYVGGGNYLKKMSDYTDSKNWEKTWTDLFWIFLLKHQEVFISNPRMAMLIKSKIDKTSNA